MKPSEYKRWTVRKSGYGTDGWWIHDNMQDCGGAVQTYATQQDALLAVARLEADSGNMDGETAMAWHIVVHFGAPGGWFQTKGRTWHRLDLDALNAAIWAHQDGYGTAGFTPAQGWDWSGIRDSSHQAVRNMAQAIRENLRAQGWVLRVEGHPDWCRVTMSRAPRPAGSTNIRKHTVVLGDLVVGIRRSPRTYTHAVVTTKNGQSRVQRWSQTWEAARAYAATLTARVGKDVDIKVLTVMRG